MIEDMLADMLLEAIARELANDPFYVICATLLQSLDVAYELRGQFADNLVPGRATGKFGFYQELNIHGLRVDSEITKRLHDCYERWPNHKLEVRPGLTLWIVLRRYDCTDMRFSFDLIMEDEERKIRAEASLYGGDREHLPEHCEDWDRIQVEQWVKAHAGEDEHDAHWVAITLEAGDLGIDWDEQADAWPISL